jgi:hypothetical protein
VERLTSVMQRAIRQTKKDVEHMHQTLLRYVRLRLRYHINIQTAKNGTRRYARKELRDAGSTYYRMPDRKREEMKVG